MTHGKEYGAALFELALNEGCLQEISQSLGTVKEVFSNEPDIERFLLSPSITKEERIGSINEAFFGRVHEYVLSLLCIMTERGHIQSFFECFDEYDALYRESVKSSQATVYSAVELTESEKSRLCELLMKRSGSKVEIEYKIDPSLIGGIVVETQGKRFDGSIKHRLREIKEKML